MPYLDENRLEDLRSLDQGRTLCLVLNLLLEELQALDEDGDAMIGRRPATIAAGAHAMRGAALQTGASRLAQAAQAVEMAASAPDPSHAILESYLAIARSTREAIKKYLQKSDN